MKQIKHLSECRPAEEDCIVILILEVRTSPWVCPWLEPDSPFLPASGTQPPLTSGTFLTEVEAPAEQRAFPSPCLLNKSRTEVSTGPKAPLLAKASAHSLPPSCLGKGGPLRELQPLQGPTTLTGKATSGL